MQNENQIHQYARVQREHKKRTGNAKESHCPCFLTANYICTHVHTETHTNTHRLREKDLNLHTIVSIHIWMPLTDTQLPAGIWCGQWLPQCCCSLCFVWHWRSTSWHREADSRIRRVCQGPSRLQRDCGPIAQHRCMPEEHPLADSAADTAPWI